MIIIIILLTDFVIVFQPLLLNNNNLICLNKQNTILVGLDMSLKISLDCFFMKHNIQTYIHTKSKLLQVKGFDSLNM